MRLGTAAVAGLAMGGAILLSGCETTKQVVGMGAGPCQNTTVTLYFEPGSDQVTDIARQIVGVTARQLKTCPVHELSILGLADPAGAPQANLDLSKRRAEAVRDAFLRAGLPVQRFSIVAAGEIGAVSASGVQEPVRRRVDVTVVMQGGKAKR